MPSTSFSTLSTCFKPDIFSLGKSICVTSPVITAVDPKPIRVQKHFDLLGRGVLGFIQNDKGIVQGTPTHEGQRRHFDDVFFQKLFNPLKPEHIVKGIVQRPQVWIDFLRHIARQKTQLFAQPLPPVAPE